MKRAVLVLVSVFQIFSLSAFAAGVQSIEIDANGNVLNSTATNYAYGQLKINGVAVTTGGGGAGTWGSITGTLSAQTDLQNALNAKQATAGTLAIAGFGSITGTLPIANLPTGTTSSTVATGDKGVTTLTLNTPALIYTNPITFTNTNGAWAGTLSPIAQSANTFFGNGTGSSATPTFMSASTARTALGGTTVGQNIFSLTNPSAITFIQINADNTVTAQSASAQRTALGLVIGTNVEAWDADLDTWATVTPAAGIATFLGTPTSANLATTITDEISAGTSPKVLFGDQAVATTSSPSFAGETITQAPAANTAAAGLTLQDTTAAASGSQQYSPYIYQTGQGWKTTATAGSQSVTFRQGVVPVQGTANPTGTWTLESSVNGAAFGNSLTYDNAGTLSIGTAITTGSGDLAVNNAYIHSGFGVYHTSGSTVGLAGGVLKMGSNSAMQWSNSTNWQLTADTGFSRNAAGIIEANSGTALKYGQLKAGTVALQSLATPAASPSAAVVGTAGSTTISYSYTDCQADGSCTAASPVVTVTTANATLTSSNKITLTFPALGTNTTYRNVYRTATNGTSPTTTGKINSSAVTTTTFDDTGLAGDASTAPSSNKTGQLLASQSISARVYNTAAESIANNSTTILTFDSERWDRDTIHDTSTNTSRLVCKTAGTYRITGHVMWAGNATGYRELGIVLNGATFLAYNDVPSVGTGSMAMEISTEYDLAVNDYVDLRAWQNSTAALNVQAGANYSPEFMMTRLP